MDYLIEQGVKFDAVITDPPYGTTACSWDNVIPFNKMWERLTKLTNEKSAIVLFGSEPFSSQLRCSNLKLYKYDWIWNKKTFANQMLAKYQPMKIHEIISVFSEGTHNYYPQNLIKVNKLISQGSKISDNNGGGERKTKIMQEFTNYPKSIQMITKTSFQSLHPTEKPLPLMEYLIKTYTKKGDLILDFTSGSGSTLVAADMNGRKTL